MIDIRLEGVTKRYGIGSAAVRRRSPQTVTAVDDVTLSVNAGELYFLLGPSGCGKTTLLRIVAGLVEPDSGRVFFGSRDVTSLPVERRNTALVFQNYALWPHMTVSENVEFGPRMRGVSRGERRRIVDANLARVQMSGFGRRLPGQLSGGQQQRIALARALAAQPECLLLDEPLSNLDARLRLQMRGELRRLVKSTGMTAVYVTHDQKEALSMADRVAVMDAGRIVQVGTPEDIYTWPATRFVADFLGEANFLDGTIVEAGPPAKIETPIGTVLVERAEGVSVGQAVTCCVRPERIAIATADELSGAPALSATIESSSYLGEMRQYVCRLGDDVRWKVSVLASSSPAFADGSAVNLRVESASLLPAE